MKKILATILATALGLGAWGGTVVVNEASYSALANAVSAASPGDIVEIAAAGTYTVPAGGWIISQNVTITGTVDGVVID